MIGIIGAGISGLSLAYHLEKQEQPYILLEASERPGGYIQSSKIQNYHLELGPNSLLVDEATEHFLHELGLESEILPSLEVSKQRYIFRDGKYRKLPAHPLALLKNSFFSWSAKWSLFQERKRPAEDYPHETIAHFFNRRFGAEITDYALNPFISGIYAGDPEQLLIEETFPQLKAYEKEYGSVLKGFIKNKGGQRKKSLSFKKGMEQLPLAIAKQLTGLVYGQEVQRISREGEDYLIHTPQETYQVQKVVIATPAFAARTFLADLHPNWAEALSNIYYPPMIAVHSAYKRHQVKHPLNGFGALHPKVENLYTAGSIWSSSVFPDRCPEDEVLFTTFVGGSQYVNHTRGTDLVTLGKVHQELAYYYGIKGTPVFQNLYRWEKAIPQYDQQILAALQMAQKMEAKNLFVCANWKDGISLADCIKKAKTLASEISENQSVHSS